MPFSASKTDIEGVLVIKPHTYFDDRGLYRKCYESEDCKALGLRCQFNECSDIYSRKGALRGLHYQTEESQAKLVHVLAGALFDVALDLRPGSATFGRYHTELLTGEEEKSVFIPEGFAHGFIALEEKTIFSYMCSGRYVPESCGGIRWDDPELCIPWPLKEYGIKQVIATEKDKNWPTLREYTRKMEQRQK